MFLCLFFSPKDFHLSLIRSYLLLLLQEREWLFKNFILSV